MVDESFIAAEAPPCDTKIPETAEKSPPEPPLPGKSDLQQEVADLKRAFADYMHTAPEIDRMRKELHETLQERDNHAAELKKLKQDQSLNSIANDYSFNDVEYLEFILQKNHVQLDDPQAVKSFMQQLKTEKPKFFNLPLKPGAGSRPGNAVENVFPGGNLKRMDALEIMISNAREII
ncbi:MAG: hypothetical protein IKD10_05310 [Lentisphaeria bacterium]|nr:hypothetical protein [Lentisphaeria bacterium]